MTKTTYVMVMTGILATAALSVNYAFSQTALSCDNSKPNVIIDNPVMIH